MNTRVKGASAEREYTKLLEEKGWIVQRVKGSNKFNRNVDFFGVADLVAFHPFLSTWLLVQVKCNSTAGAVKKLTEWTNNHKPPHCNVQVAVRRDNKNMSDRWKIYSII